jgi:hypothetical protein
MKLTDCRFRAPIRVPGLPGVRDRASLAEGCDIDLDENLIRLTAGGDTVFVPFHMVLDFRAEPTKPSKKGKS